MAEKPKVIFYWCASCGGCEEAVVDLAEDILTVVENVDIVFWPVAMDFKRSDVEKLPDKSVLVSFINGAIRTSEQEEMVRLLRQKSRYVVAFGSCAHIGGIPGLANVSNREEIFNFVYREAPNIHNPGNLIPQNKINVDGKELELPLFYDTVKTLNQTIDVDYYLPGCAPPPDLIMNGVMAFLNNNLPEKGSVLSPARSVCDTCPRKDSKPERLSINEIKRPHEVLDNGDCFLAQGIICMGPATRNGCGERCIRANMPCRGCFGPAGKTVDQGGKALSSLASIIGVDYEEELSEEELEKLLDPIVDPLGLFYMYSLPASILRRTKKVGGKNDK